MSLGGFASSRLAGKLAYAPRPGRDATGPGVSIPRWDTPDWEEWWGASQTCREGGGPGRESQALPRRPANASFARA